MSDNKEQSAPVGAAGGAQPVPRTGTLSTDANDFMKKAQVEMDRIKREHAAVQAAAKKAALAKVAAGGATAPAVNLFFFEAHRMDINTTSQKGSAAPVIGGSATGW